MKAEFDRSARHFVRRIAYQDESLADLLSRALDVVLVEPEPPGIIVASEKDMPK